MAKTSYPFFAIAAAGSVGKLTTSRQPGTPMGQHVTRWKPAAPSGERSPAQLTYNDRFRHASQTWATLAPALQAWWVTWANTHNKIGRNEFIRESILQRVAPGIEPLHPVNYEGGAF